MDNQNQENRVKMTDEEYVGNVITLSSEYLTIIERIETAQVEHKRDIVRDLSNAGLALLGGILTIATVAPALMRTPLAVFIGAAIVLLSVILAFYVRIKIGRRFTRIIDKQYNDFSMRTTAARKLIWNQDYQKAKFEMENDLKNTPFDSEDFPRSLAISDIIIAILLLSGAALIVTGLIFNISIN